jgi:hypothetical protein
MDERTLNIIAEWELREDILRAEQHGVSLGLFERNNDDGSLTITLEGERQFWALMNAPPPTLH